MFRRIDSAIVALASTGRHRRALLAAAVLVSSGLSAACSDLLFGSKAGGVAHIGLAPHFGPKEAAIYSELDRFNLGVETIRIVLTRPNTTDTLADTTITIPPGADSIVAQVYVTLDAPQEVLTAAMEMRSGSVLVFSGTTTVVAKVGGVAGIGTPQPVLVPLWVGPGKDVVRIAISPQDPAMPADGSITFSASAFGANDAPFSDPDYEARWQWVAIDSNLASFTPGTSTLVGKGTPGTARIMVFTPNLLRDTVTVTLLSGQATAVTFARGVEIVDVNATVSAPATARGPTGQPIAGVAIAYTSRTPAIATVNPTTGAITGVTKGQTVIVASLLSGVADSIIAAVAEPGGPVLVSSLERFRLPRDTQLTVSVFVDMRTSTKRLGSATVDVEWSPAQFQFVSHANGASGVSPTVNSSNTSTGKIVLAFADVAGFNGRVELLRITLRSSTGNSDGQLKLTARELNATDYSDLLPLTVQVLQSISVR